MVRLRAGRKPAWPRRYGWAIGRDSRRRETPEMKKRALAAVLWAATGWYVGALLGWILNVGPVLPVLLALSAAWMFAGDPRRIIWSTGDPSSRD